MSMKLVPCMSAMINHSSAPMKVASEELLETASHAAGLRDHTKRVHNGREHPSTAHSDASGISELSGRSGRTGPPSDLARAGMNALKRVGACWRCIFSRKKCDPETPCLICPKGGKSNWEALGCHRGDFKTRVLPIRLCPRQLPEICLLALGSFNNNPPVDNQVRGLWVNKVASITDTDESLRKCKFFPLQLSFKQTGKAINLSPSQLSAYGAVSKYFATSTTFFRHHTRFALVMRASIDYIRETNMNITLYLDELARVLFKKENLRNKGPSWLSIFYSFCIQSLVRTSLRKSLRFTTINGASETNVAANQYLYLPLRLFIASNSGFKDPLLSDESAGYGFLSTEHSQQAREAVNYADWNSSGNHNSGEYLNKIFQDDGSVLEASPAKVRVDLSTEKEDGEVPKRRKLNIWKCQQCRDVKNKVRRTLNNNKI
ncbi:hypothetical protein BGZ57DRAFT_970938 [Hyaloscypha finlandica]|nr:hypothetical protein BGZ57DRAFT_970938 [Hyaloscypha finlandica]